MHDGVSTQVSFLYCVTQNQHYVQIYHSYVYFYSNYHSDVYNFVNTRGACPNQKRWHMNP